MRGQALSVAAVVVSAAATVLVRPPAAAAEPPGIPDAAAARTLLDGLTVAEESSARGYSRDKFPHWNSVGECTIRETVLHRDGLDVTVDGECQPTGRWFSPYDDRTMTDPADIDVDHVVPLAESWRSGASEWSTEQREQFANDLESPQLIAVTASSNRTKGDRDPASWHPIPAFECTYSRMWVAVKARWQLTLQQAEKDVLTRMLSTC
ncbi:DUF1524 domain-containing protein [Nocardia sp. NPDC058499]|uniref:HNH endonuclease family protein n=1 Tax=Nocardia sp. NPDC058499 TaxID=3346530 RepID=UPI00364D7CA5